MKVLNALHLNGMRYSKQKTPAWLGSLSYEDHCAYALPKKISKCDRVLVQATGKDAIPVRMMIHFLSSKHWGFYGQAQQPLGLTNPKYMPAGKEVGHFHIMLAEKPAHSRRF